MEMVAEVVREPELSVVIAVVSDAKHLEGCLNALLNQTNPVPMEIIVPYVAGESGIQALKSHFPGVLFLPVESIPSMLSDSGTSREHHDELRATGLAHAKGKILALIEDHGRVDKDWALRMIEAQRASCAGVGGAIDNEVNKPLNWAIYFCDFGRYQRPFPAGPSFFISDANSSYKRQALERIQDIWEKSFHETSVNSELLARGETLWLSPEPVVYQHRENLSVSRALQERYVWGRSFAGTRARELGLAKRFLYLILSPALTFLLVARKIRAILIKKRNAGAFLKAFPLTLLLLTFWSFGEFVGYLTGRPNARIKTTEQPAMKKTVGSETR
jgi:hypothetical protein